MAASIPIIRLYGVLLVAIQVELSDELVKSLRSDLGREIQTGDVRGVVLELSGVDTFDTYIARSLRDIAQIAKLMGVKTVITGLDPGIAITLVEMGMQLEGVFTTLSLETALAMLLPHKLEAERRRAPDDGLVLDEANRVDDELFDLDELDEAT
jgi:rsbT antagonist protein RsbS